MTDYGARKNQYFVPGDGIAREVITSDICKYLDNDATVRPYTYEGRDGYMVYAYRNLTTAMIEDLRRDTIFWEREKDRRGTDRRSDRGGDRGGSRSTRYDSGYGQPPQNANSRPTGNNAGGFPSHQDAMAAYQDSATHERRSQIGPSQPLPQPPVNSNVMDIDPRSNPSPHSSNDGYTRPMMPYQQNQSPQHVTQYPPNQVVTGHSPAAHGTSSISNPPMYRHDWGNADPNSGYQNDYQNQMSYQSTSSGYSGGQAQQNYSTSRNPGPSYPNQAPPNSGNSFGSTSQVGPGYSSNPSKRTRYDDSYDSPDPRSGGYGPDARGSGRNSGGSAGGSTGYSNDSRGPGNYGNNYQGSGGPSGRDRDGRRGY